MTEAQGVHGLHEGEILFIDGLLSVPWEGEHGWVFAAAINGKQHMIFLPTRTASELVQYLGGRPRRWWRRKDKR